MLRSKSFYSRLWRQRSYCLFPFIVFALNLAWENLQAPLYAGFVSFAVHFPMCLAGAIGDVIISMAALFFVILLKQELPLKPNKYDFVAIAILGFAIAVAIEQNALLAGKWSYAPSMPLVPRLGIGLAPVAQMTLLLPLSLYLTRLLDKKSPAEI